MLIFFIHGVATRNAKYADNLKFSLQKSLRNQLDTSIFFYSSFWGNVLRPGVDRMWNSIDKDLNRIKQKYPKSVPEDIFRYQKFRQGILSDFLGDFFTYLNTERGASIRQIIAGHLEEFLKHYSEETELHIIAHSLGTVILWELLFSEEFSTNDSAFRVRAMIKGLSDNPKEHQVKLKSITTMGSPILFFNSVLGRNSLKVTSLARQYSEQPLRWMNLIHSSDIIAYPLRSSLNCDEDEHLFVRDRYIWENSNLKEKGLLKIGNESAALALGVADAHSCYWTNERATELIQLNILGDISVMESEDFTKMDKFILNL